MNTYPPATQVWYIPEHRKHDFQFPPPNSLQADWE